jgi:hypothetical protein
VDSYPDEVDASKRRQALRPFAADVCVHCLEPLGMHLSLAQLCEANEQLSAECTRLERLLAQSN